jgi:hypothetical protein
MKIVSPANIAEIFNRLDVTLSGPGGPQSVGLASINDYGFVYRMNQMYKTNILTTEFRDKVLHQGNISTGDMDISTHVFKAPFVVPHLLGFLGAEKGSRWLPLDVLPNASVSIQLHAIQRWWSQNIQTNNSTSSSSSVDLLKTIELADVYLSFDIIRWDNEEVMNAFKQRLLTTPIAYPFTNYSTAVSYPFIDRLYYQVQINTQSLDKLYFCCRPQYYNETSSQDKIYSISPGQNYSITMLVNNVPISSLPFKEEDVLCNLHLVFGRDMSVGDPENSGTQITRALFNSKYFLCGVPYELNAYDAANKAWVTGKNSTNGFMNLTLRVEATGATNIKYGVFIMEHTSILMVYAGRRCMFLN